MHKTIKKYKKSSIDMSFMETPKEKAYSLYKRFYNVKGQDLHNTVSSKMAKECAKLYIDLVLESEVLKPSNNLVIEYYQKVIKQINEL